MADLQESSSLDAEVTAQNYTSRREMREAQSRATSAPRKRPDAAAAAPREARTVKTSPRRPRRSAVAELRASTTEHHKRKNPLSVLATMTVVVGMFAVAGLPAYAMTGTQLVSSSKEGLVAQALTVSSDAAASATQRDGFSATTPEQLEEMNADALRAEANALYLTSGARELGDDYPWPYELTDDQGGGLSPLNYYFRECVDFVAWRINRDQGYYAAPFKWVWSNLTPYGGNGGQWQYNWEALGRTVSQTPIVGAVAYTGGNHVAYVKSVNADGTVTLEEYNYVPGMYSQRTIPATSVASFLYPPS